MQGLTRRQRLFIHYYLNDADQSTTKAARMAGYPHPDVQGSRLLSNARVRAAIDSQLEQVGLNPDDVLARIADIATVDIADFISFENGSIKVDVEKAVKRGKGNLIKKLTPTKFGWSVELRDSLAALEKLGRYHGLWKDANPTLTMPDGRVIDLAGVNGRSTH